MRSARGQGTVEYLAVVLLVLVALGGGSAAVASATGADIATAVPHEVMRALCIVTRGDCDRDRAPCDVASTTDSDRWNATIAVIRVGRDRVIIRRRRSDGREVITLTTAGSLGLQTTDGAGAKVDRGRRRVSIGDAVTASIVASLGRGRSWIVPAGAAADAFVAALAHDDAVRPPDETLTQVDLVPGVTFARGAGSTPAGVGASATIGVHGTVGRSTDRLTGSQTYFLEGGADAVLGFSASLGTLRAAGSAGGAASARLALTVDRSGRWSDLALVATGAVSGTLSLPPEAQPIADALDVPGSAGRRWVAEAHLDLSDPRNLAAARTLVGRLGAFPPRPGAVGSAAADVARRIDERAVIDVRAYTLDNSTNGFDVHVGKGAGFGAGHEHAIEETRLIAATTRGLDGQWRRRLDCLEEVRT